MEATESGMHGIDKSTTMVVSLQTSDMVLLQEGVATEGAYVTGVKETRATDTCTVFISFMVPQAMLIDAGLPSIDSRLHSGMTPSLLLALGPAQPQMLQMWSQQRQTALPGPLAFPGQALPVLVS